MQRYVYGDSYGGVAQNELGLDAARDSRYFQSLADQRARQSAADNMYLQQQAMANQRQSQQDAMAQAFAFHNDDNAYKQQSLAQNKDLFQAQLDNSKDLARMGSIDRQKSFDVAQGGQAYNELFQAINQGNVKTPQDLQAMAGNRVSPEALQRLSMYLDSAAARQQHAYELSQQMADGYNQRYNAALAPFAGAAQTAQEEIKHAPLAASKHWYNPTTWGTSREELEANPPMPVRNLAKANDDFSKMFLKDKNAQRMISFDPATSHFVPVMSPPDYVPNQSQQPRMVPVTGKNPILASAPTPGALPTMDDGSGYNDAQPYDNEPQWQKLPGTSIELHPQALQSILAQVSQTPVGPARTILARKLANEALASGYGRQAAVAQYTPEFDLPPFEGMSMPP